MTFNQRADRIMATITGIGLFVIMLATVYGHH